MLLLGMLLPGAEREDPGGGGGPNCRRGYCAAGRTGNLLPSLGGIMSFFFSWQLFLSHTLPQNPTIFAGQNEFQRIGTFLRRDDTMRNIGGNEQISTTRNDIEVRGRAQLQNFASSNCFSGVSSGKSELLD